MPDPIQWGSLGQPKPEGAANAYTNVLKQQQEQQNIQYNRARIQEQEALAQQHQRVTDAKNGLASALSKNTDYNPDGTAKINYAGAIKDLNDSGFGDLSPDLIKEAAAQHTNDLTSNQKTAERLGDLSGNSFRVQHWNDPNEVARARTEALSSIDQAVKEGVLDQNTAAAYRTQAANYNPDFQSHLDQIAAGGKTLGTRYAHEKAGTDALVAHLTAQPKVDTAVANADTAQTKATEAGMDLAGRTVGAGVVPANSEIGGNAPQAAYPGVTPPGAPNAYVAPQAAPAPTAKPLLGQ